MINNIEEFKNNIAIKELCRDVVRFEVITPSKKRQTFEFDFDQPSIQDDGKTLKIFLN